MDKLFSIIVPIYNIKEEYLRKCILSALDQGDAEYEVILVNDGSLDYCEKICKEFSDEYSTVKYIYQENQGVSVARNTGIDVACGEYIVFLDADDWLPKGFLEKAKSLLGETRPDVVFYGYSSEYTNKTLNRFFPVDISLVTNENLIKSVLRDNSVYGIYDVSTIWAKLIKRELLVRNNIRFVKGIKRGQDTLFSLYFYLSCKSFETFHEIGYCYRKNEASVMHRFNDNIIQIVENLHNRYVDFLKTAGMDTEINDIMSKLRVSALMGDYLDLYFCHKGNPKSKNELITEYCNLKNKPEYSDSILNYKPQGFLDTVAFGVLKSEKIKLLWTINRVKFFVFHFFLNVYK